MNRHIWNSIFVIEFGFASEALCGFGWHAAFGSMLRTNFVRFNEHLMECQVKPIKVGETVHPLIGGSFCEFKGNALRSSSIHWVTVALFIRFLKWRMLDR